MNYGKKIHWMSLSHLARELLAEPVYLHVISLVMARDKDQVSSARSNLFHVSYQCDAEDPYDTQLAIFGRNNGIQPTQDMPLIQRTPSRRRNYSRCKVSTDIAQNSQTSLFLYLRRWGTHRALIVNNRLSRVALVVSDEKSLQLRRQLVITACWMNS